MANIQTNAYGQQYIGNDDFRGYLAALAAQKPAASDINAQVQHGYITNGLTGGSNGLGYINNSGQINTPLAQQLLSTDDTSGLQNYVNGLYSQYTAARSGGGGGGGTGVNRSNDIAVQNAALGGADTQLSTGLSAVDKALQGLLGKYDTEASSNEENYTDQSNTNQNNLQKNKQTALVNAAQGRQGLFGTLASLGALSGSGIDLANRAVQQGANTDLSGAADTYGENQTGLDTAINTFRTQDKERRDDAQTAAEDAKTNVRNQVAQAKQKAYSALADDYTQEGDTGNASKFAQMAASLFPQIAQTSVPSTNLSYSAAAFTPGTLSDYLSNGNTQVQAAPTGGDTNGLPTLVANNQANLKKKTGASTVATGATA